MENNQIQKALRYYQTEDFPRSESLCKKILQIQPDNGEILHLLGSIYYATGNYDLALEYFRKALSCMPDNKDIYYDLGNVFQEQSRIEEAMNCYEKVLLLDPEYIAAYINIGVILDDEGKLDEAIDTYRKALQIEADVDILNNNLGLALQEKGRFDEAVTYFLRATQLNPQYADAYYNLGNAYLGKRQFDKALDCYKKAIRWDPTWADAYYNQGIVLHEKERFDEALISYQKALQFKSDFAEAYLNMGIVYKKLDKSDEAVTAFDKALEYRPKYFLPLWSLCMSRLRSIYPDQSSIERSRTEYHDELVKLHNIISTGSPVDVEIAAEAVGKQNPFYLAYQGFNDRELQAIYGDMVYKIMSFNYPQFDKKLIMPPHLPGEKLRIGIVSGFFFDHSNWKIPIKGWVQNLDRRRFQLFGYYTGEIKDRETEIARQCFNRFLENVHSFEDICRSILQDNLHVLIFPEIGMDPTTIKLAALNLAPIQCNSWGHPVTSGYPTIDYFISSDLMEPSEADNHYTERLVRLPNLSMYYDPLAVPCATVDRTNFGIHGNSLLYLCCQSLFKYLPQYDEVFPRIAQHIEDCRFLFISSRNSVTTEKFRSRIYQAFRRYNLSAEDYVVFLPQLDSKQYNEINCVSDIYLDSIWWSGCNTTFEAIYHNLPIVTIKGEFMRGRHSAAILAMMDLTETIASTLDEYVTLAVRLGQDPAHRKRISEKMASNKRLIYRDGACISALEDFLEKVVREKLDKMIG